MSRYDEYGEGRGSASNSDQTGTLSRASYHSSDPDHYPDLLDIPNRFGAYLKMHFSLHIYWRKQQQIVTLTFPFDNLQLPR